MLTITIHWSVGIVASEIMGRQCTPPRHPKRGSRARRARRHGGGEVVQHYELRTNRSRTGGMNNSTRKVRVRVSRWCTTAEGNGIAAVLPTFQCGVCRVHWFIYRRFILIRPRCIRLFILLFFCSIKYLKTIQERRGKWSEMINTVLWSFCSITVLHSRNRQIKAIWYCTFK